MKKIDIALNNECKFCENIEGLKNHYGSNIGELIREIIPKYRN